MITPMEINGKKYGVFHLGSHWLGCGFTKTPYHVHAQIYLLGLMLGVGMANLFYKERHI